MSPTTADADVTAVQRVRPRALVAPLGVWTALAVCGFLVGALRELLLFPYLGGYPSALFASQLFLLVVLGVSGLYFARTSVAYSRAELLLIGAGWALATVGFEVLLGALVPSVARYGVLAGPIRDLVPVALLVAPLVFGWSLR